MAFVKKSVGHSSTNIVPISERAFQDMCIMFNGIGRDLFINISGPVLKVVRSNDYYGPKFVLVDKLDDEKKENKNK